MTTTGNVRTVLPVYDVGDDLRAVFERDGVVLVRDLLSPAEVAEVRSNIARYEKWILQGVPEEWVRHEEDGSVRGMYYLERADPYFAAFGARTDFPALVERITGARASFASMETFHKQPLVGSPSLVHQDGIYYQGTSIEGVNVWIPLDHASARNATLKYWPGTHRSGLLPHGGTKDDPYFRAMRPEDITPLGPPSYAELPPGWGALHCDKIVHGSDANTSPHQRLAIAATYTLERD